VIHLSQRQEKELDIHERESMQWYRQMRIQEEQWRTKHFPVRDIVFKDHDQSYHRAVTSAAKARVCQRRCIDTQSQYSNMKNDYKEGLEQLTQVCQKKIEKEVEQFNSEIASEDIKKEE